MTVLLENGTTGAVGKAVIGQKVTVRLFDENGNSIHKTGIVKEILED